MGSAPEFRGRPVKLSRAARRGVRQAAQLADELNLYSFRTHVDGSVTWVRWRDQPPAQPQHKKKCDGEASRKNGEPSKSALARAERGRTYFERMSKAATFRCVHALRQAVRHWSQQASRRHSASAAPTPQPGGPEVGISGAGNHAGDSAIPLRRALDGGAAHIAQQVQMGGDRPVPPHGQAGDASLMANEERRPGLQSPSASTRAMCVSPDAHGPDRGRLRSQSTLPPGAPVTPLRDHGTPGSPGAHASAHAQHMDINMYIARMREHEYPQYMGFHMQQGMPREAAHAAWVSYERMKVEGMMRGHMI